MAQLPANIPPPFDDIARRCLNRSPTKRPTVIELETQFKLAQQADLAPGAEPLAQHASPLPTPSLSEIAGEVDPSQPTSKGLLWGLAVAAVIVIALGAWVGLQVLHKHSNSRLARSDELYTLGTVEGRTGAGGRDRPAAGGGSVMGAAAAVGGGSAASGDPVVGGAHSVAPAGSATATAGSAADLPSPQAEAREPAALWAAPAASGSVEPNPTTPSSSALHEEMPNVPRNIREKIRGTIKTTVRVLVDPSGNVVGEFLESPGPSRYFARVAGDAAVNWKFPPAKEQGPRVWMLRFEFTRAGATVQAAAR